MSVSEAQMRATSKYNAKMYDQVIIRIPGGSKDLLKELAQIYGDSLTAMFMKAIFKMVENDPPENLSDHIKGQLALLKKDAMAQAERGKKMRDKEHGYFKSFTTRS